MTINSYNPATGEIVWKGTPASKAEIDAAIASSRNSLETWSNLSFNERMTYLFAFRDQIKKHSARLAEVISIETGKPLWESHTEVNAMIGKVGLSVDAYRQRCTEIAQELPGARSITRHKPHGVVAVLGPYNFPGHLPNGHIVPALLAGNTVVFKPSELTPLVGELMVQIWRESGLLDGVLNLVQGGRETGSLLASHADIDGLFFTGSWLTGKFLLEHFSAHPEKILALEMGGNNPLIASHISDKKAAAYLTILSAYLTSGQRCSCARRLILVESSESNQFLEILQKMIAGIQIGAFSEQPEPFMGPVISLAAAEKILAAQESLKKLGGKPLIEMRQIKPGLSFLSPGLCDVTAIHERPDEEIFGPFLQVIRVPNFEAAIQEANHTQYGLTAGLLSDDRSEYEEFYRKARAGVINWNAPLTGASSAAPFGGIKRSGNHRPSAYYAADYCSYPIASMENEKIKMPAPFAGLRIE